MALQIGPCIGLVDLQHITLYSSLVLIIHGCRKPELNLLYTLGTPEFSTTTLDMKHLDLDRVTGVALAVVATTALVSTGALSILAVAAAMTTLSPACGAAAVSSALAVGSA